MPSSSLAQTLASQIEELVHCHAASIAAAMPNIVADAQNEEGIRLASSELVNRFLKEARIKVKPLHEYGLSGGRIDSKYGGVILEYKNPHTQDRIGIKLESHGTKELIKQLKERFDDFESEEHLSRNRIFGCGLDGRNILFVRHRGKEFEVENPQPITPLTIERLLRAFVSLGATGKSFTPESLERDFGSDAPTAQSAINALYAAICATKNARAKTFFDEWKILYGEVCGYDVNKVNDKVRELAKHYGIKSPSAAELLFSIHTYYSIIIKFLASEIIANFAGFATSIVKKCVSAPSSSALKREAQALEDGGNWKSWGINNFLEGDLFAWYVAAWDENVYKAVRAVALDMDAYDSSTLSIEPNESRDLLKKLYQHLFPQSVRHDLGEYYTPDWLAEMTLDRIGYIGDPRKRILDPACGSGTFLVAAINRTREWFETHRDSCGFDEKKLVELLLSNVVGFELNPLAVMASRTNYLLAIRDFIKLLPSIELPIYLCDSVMTPAEYGELFTEVKRLKTSVGEFVIPAEISKSSHNLATYADLIERSIADKDTATEFIQLCKDQGLSVGENKLHRDLFEKIRTLESQNRNGIWARIIKNSFAPLFTARFDFIVGNPPWINWESLPRDYRESLIPIWKRYELFTLSGSAGRLGGGKKDMSMLFVYVSIDKYLNDNCKLGFVITQSVFKTKGAGDGFRRLRYEDGATRYYLAPVQIDDLSDIQIFDGATNRTALAIFEKRENKFNYPVQYSIWRGPSRIKQDTSLSQVSAKVRQIDAAAVPVDPSASRSPWLTVPKAALPACRKIIGISSYSAQAGCTTWLNGVYWIKVLEQKPGGLLFVENLYDIGKKTVEHCKVTIEEEFVFPLLRGEDVHRWNAKPSLKIIVPQDPATRKGISVSILKTKARRTYSYLMKFESALRQRSDYKKYFKETDPFYSIYNVDKSTYAPHKVAWRDMGDTIQAAVIEQSRESIVCPEHHVMFIAVKLADEAHYICALMNTTYVRLLVAGYTTNTGISTHVADLVRIPIFNADNEDHKELAKYSRECHSAVKADDASKLNNLLDRIDHVAAKIWDISNAEFISARQALTELGIN